jgi:hypothetical protein
MKGDFVELHRVATGLLLSLAAFAAPAQERDILDAAAERPAGITANNQPVRFGDPDLDNAEITLRDYLPRPWTTTRIHALYLAAYTRLAEAQKQTNVSSQDRVTDEWTALVEQLGSILAASRDPRAALALGRVIESPERLMVTCTLARNFMTYFLADTSYQSPPADAPGPRAFNGCMEWPARVHKWWLLNQREVEQRAAAMIAGAPPCPNCEQEALAAIDQLRVRLHDSAPMLRLTIQGGGTPRDMRMEFTISPVSGPSGGTRSMTNYPYTSPDIRLRIPGRLLGHGDMQISGIVMSTGYRTVPFEFDRINDARAIPVTLVPIGSKTLTGTITFSSDAAPRPFGLRANLRVSGSNDPNNTFANSMTLVQNIAEATVDQDGRFSIVVPDVTQDPILNNPANLYQLTARNGNWVLLPDVIAIDHPAQTALNIVVAPRPGSPASTSANPGPPLPVTGRVIDADGRPVPAAQVVIVNSTRLESLRCPENGEACFAALQATGAARALGVSGNDGSFTLQVPVGLMPNDSVWAEGRDASGKSVRTSWPISPNRSLPTSSLGDIRLSRRMDFTVVVRGDGKPIAGAEVEFVYQGTKLTDAAGAVELHQQVPGSPDATLWSVQFTVRAAGFASVAWDGGIATGTTTQVIELEREAVQRGRVVDDGGRALGNVTVQAHAVERAAFGMGLHDPFPDSKTGSARTDDTGAFTLRGLHGGRRYRLVVISAEGAVTNGERIVTASDAPVDIVVPAARFGAASAAGTR